MFSTSAVTHSGRPRGTRAIILDWSLRVVLAVFFAGVAIPKLANVHSSAYMFAEIGVGQWLQYAVGVAELAGAIGLLISPLAGLAAIGLCLDMIGASIVNIAVLHSTAVVLTAALALVFAGLASRHGVTKPLGKDRQSKAPKLANSPQESHERLDKLLMLLQADAES